MSQGEQHQLPSLLCEISEVLDLEAALLIAREWGGMRIYFPADVDAEHKLVKLIGFERAKTLCLHFASGANSQRGFEFEIPQFFNNQKNIARKIDEMTKDGISSDQIANRLKVSRRTVVRRRTKVKAQLIAKDQLKLF